MQGKFRQNVDRVFWASLVVALLSAAFTAYIFFKRLDIVGTPHPAALSSTDAKD